MIGFATSANVQTCTDLVRQGDPGVRIAKGYRLPVQHLALLEERCAGDAHRFSAVLAPCKPGRQTRPRMVDIDFCLWMSYAPLSHIAHVGVAFHLYQMFPIFAEMENHIHCPTLH